MNQLAPYAAFFMRLAVGGVFLRHGIQKFEMGIPAVAGFLHNSAGIPFASMFAVVLTRAWATCMAVEMVVAILTVQLPHGSNFELEGLLLAGAVTLMALGDGPLSVAVRFKRPAI